MSISFGWYCHHYHHLHANVDAKIASTLSFIYFSHCLLPVSPCPKYKLSWIH